MKGSRVIIVHGTGGNPGGNWFPWLATQVEEAGATAIIPAFPTPEGQELAPWLEIFDAAVGSIDGRTIVVGHSLGCGFLLRVLERAGERAAATALVSGFVGKLGNDFDALNAPFFRTEFDWSMIKARAGAIAVMNGDDDPYVPPEKGEELAGMLGAELDIIHGAGHINAESGYTEFPQVMEFVRTHLD